MMDVLVSLELEAALKKQNTFASELAKWLFAIDTR